MSKIDQPEHRLSHHCCALLERILVGDCHFTAVDTGTQMVSKSPQARMNWENHRKWMGIKPHHLDIYIHQRSTGIYTQIELKVGGNHLTTGQEDTVGLLVRKGYRPGVAWTIRQFFDAIAYAGFELHGNAENIVREIEQRYAAAQDTADLKKAAPPKKPMSAKPRDAKPTQGELRKFAGVRARAAARGILI